eukprot:TRINITY_DN8827_c1_g1_i2.p1 TRINITY_DN8827_c1_g1~~TRINITY_DN8827_c1_g1_i2.p1  ORF type:complete len:533 (-),score=100.44 TRINITY_DN8827_c1_g1_i2:177-1775(-)
MFSRFFHRSRVPYTTTRWVRSTRKTLAGVLVGCTLVLGTVWVQVQAEASDEKITKDIAGRFIDGLPEFSAEDVGKHRTPSEGYWVTYREGVYDITEFVSSHPGGNKILQAAGGSIDPFWALYGQHRTDEVAIILERLRIGNFKKSGNSEPVDFNDPYANDPKRHSSLLVRTQKPFNSESPRAVLSEFITPNELFYVRNHLPVPSVDPSSYRLELGGEGLQSLTLSLEEIKKLPKVTVTSTIQCAGVRRNELKEIKPVRGLDWDIGAIGNATWGGCRLNDVLALIGADIRTLEGSEIRHVQFEGLDSDSEKNYGASIPVEKATDPRGDVILAWEMNGEELPRDHGYPIRVIVPGTVGARNVKWLRKVFLSKEESHSHWQRNDYKGFGPNIDWDSVDFDSATSIQELPVLSAISEPVEGQVIDTPDLEIKGFAFSGGGRDIYRVDLSLDGGLTWQQANLNKPTKEPYNRAWSWSPWNLTVPVTKEMSGKTLEICSRAVNSSYDSQPSCTSAIWNLRGVLCNSWHRIRVVVPKDE